MPKNRYSPSRARLLAQPLRPYRYTRWHWRWLFRMLDAVWCRPVAALRRLRAPRVPKEPRSILVVQLDHLGDAVLTTTIFPLLKTRYPSARIDVLAARWNREIFYNNPHIGRIHVSQRNWFGRERGARGFLQESLLQGLAMRRHKYDLGIDVRGDFLAALLLWTARIPRRLGWGAGGGAFLLTDCPEWVPDRPEIDARMALLAPLGIASSVTARPQLFPTEADRANVAARLARRVHGSKAVLGHGGGAGALHRQPASRRRALVVLHVSAGTEAKRWPVGHLRELVRQLILRLEVDVLLVGEEADRRLSERVAGGFDSRSVLDWTGRLRILELAALLEQSDLFIGADSGPAHLAGWAGVPTVVLFSGSNRVGQWRPKGERVEVLHHPVACSPCHRKQCAFAEHPCMVQITPAEVCAMAARMLGIGHGTSSGLTAEFCSPTPLETTLKCGVTGGIEAIAAGGR